MKDDKMPTEPIRSEVDQERPSDGAHQMFSPIFEGVSIRLLSPLGDYPAGEFRNPEASIVVRPDLIAMVTSFVRVETPEDYYSETEFLSPFEIRLLAAVLLSWDTDSGMFGLYPVRTDLQRPYTGLDLSSPGVLDGLIEEFRAFLVKSPPFAEIHRPPCAGGRSYHFNEYSELRCERQPEIFAAIDVNDHLAVRGLGALIKANMLGCFPEFLENACMSLWIAMDASMHMIQRELKESGMDNPTAKDAGRFLDDAFNWEDSNGYFADYYDGRIKTVHPESRFGAYPAAPLYADDFYDLNASLLLVYDFLLTDHVPGESEEG
jgi:hypothetical protein